MKKHLLLLLSLSVIFLSQILKAQKDISLSFGANRSSILWKNLDERGWQYKSGYFIGLRNTYYKRKKIELSSEFQFSQKGWSTENLNQGKENYNYLDGIHLFTYKPVEYIGIFGGINTAYLLSDHKELFIDTKFDLGLVGGIVIGGPKLKVFASYNNGLLNTVKEVNSIEDLGIKVVNSNLQIGLRLSFYNDKKIDSTKVISNNYELGVATANLSNYGVLFKHKLNDNKYARYNVSIADIDLKKLEQEKQDLIIFLRLGFGIEKRKNFKKIEMLSGWMYGLGVSYQSNSFFTLSPAIGYLIGAQYKYKNNWNIGVELVPRINFEIAYKKDNRYEFNTSLVYFNSPTFFINYRLGNK